ncbi:MAG: ribosomal protein S18-alanine N-acetyltransferase [Thiohalocapsa sp.]|uniref:ribosomal protein S18-alanine N-acetyltransferase n=1 Tax=Thiohalocapsa sp. TaxID=2497641 RepID=UPI0025D8615D|nr:ribosomal protein S18-alanine N-acetyltransferase [Thiohalocapsa sp.]MCG6940480.1 ribosomal protein S18-alanine N-acetyltransferase [Thiohalocapsa sp.]
MSVSFRGMREEDLPAVLVCERAGYGSPWSEGIFRDCLRVRYTCLVAETRDMIVGHGIMSVAVGECHLLNLCVHPLFQRLGIGRRMLRRLLALARREEADSAFLEVRMSNAGAIRLYRSEGFDEIGLRKGYYPSADADPSRREDALMMGRAL